MDPYDQFHYQSIPFPDTSPEHLAVLGRLFGLNPAPPDGARILELGCASGGNLIPLASQGSRGQALRLTFRKDELDSGQYSQGRFRMARPLRIEH